MMAVAQAATRQRQRSRRSGCGHGVALLFSENSQLSAAGRITYTHASVNDWSRRLHGGRDVRAREVRGGGGRPVQRIEYVFAESIA